MSTQACDTEFDATQKTNPAVHAALPELSPGSTVGRYLVIGEVGVGGMGRVLRAYAPKLEREVALKLLRTDVLDSAAQARSLPEARAMAHRRCHPNVVAAHDVFPQPATPEPTSILASLAEVKQRVDMRQWWPDHRKQQIIKALEHAQRAINRGTKRVLAALADAGYQGTKLP